MKTFDFYGVCGNRYKLDNTVWEAIEDKSDGYRSYLGSIEISTEKSDDIFFPDSLGKVYVQKYDQNDTDGWTVVDEATGHVWLVIGTNHSDSYYPSFRFEYTPKDPAKFKPDGKLRDWESFILSIE